MRLDNPFDDGKAEAGAAEAPGFRAIHLVEPIPDAAQLILGNANALVMDNDFDSCLRVLITVGELSLRWFSLDRNRTAVGAKLDGIAHQVVKHFAQAAGIPQNVRQIRRDLDLHRKAMMLRGEARALCTAPHHAGQVNGRLQMGL